MGDYENFLKHKEALTKALEVAILTTLNNMTSEEIKQLDWFNYNPIGNKDAKVT